MISPRKISANRVNARFSTGPRTRAGKAAVAGNARRHGLSLPLVIDQPLAAEIEKLAREIAGPAATLEQLQLARSVAAAQFNVIRVRRARQDLLVRYLTKTGYRSTKEVLKILSNLELGLGYLKRKQIPPPELLVADPPPEGVSKFAAIISDLAPKLSLMDRYERRAVARRRSAIRALDSASFGKV